MMQTREFVKRTPSDDRDFAGSLYVQSGKIYLVEMPNGEAVALCYDNKNGLSQQKLASTQTAKATAKSKVITSLSEITCKCMFCKLVKSLTS